ncbi:hypothetical protein Tco_1146016 [Tanacetum coccineum]
MSQMPLYSQLEGTGSSVGTAEGSAKAKMVSRILLRVLLILFRIKVSNVALCDRAVGEASAEELDPLMDPIYLLNHKLTGISMAWN